MKEKYCLFSREKQLVADISHAEVFISTQSSALDQVVSLTATTPQIRNGSQPDEMPEVGSNALKGIEEYIEGHHSFKVTTQSKVKADRMYIAITRARESTVKKVAKSTGRDRWNVSKEDNINVYNAHV